MVFVVLYTEYCIRYQNSCTMVNTRYTANVKRSDEKGILHDDAVNYQTRKRIIAWSQIQWWLV